MPLLDLSHPLEHGVPTFPGFPTPRMSHHITFEQSQSSIMEGRRFAIDLIELIGGSATYMDAPRHFDPDGTDIAGIALRKLVQIPVTVARRPCGRREYLPADFEGLAVEGHAVLLSTGMHVHWGTPGYAVDPPFLGGDAARALVASGVALVGIDAVLIDDVQDPDPRPRNEAHATILAAGIPLIENLASLDDLPATGASLTAVPAAVRGVGSFPVRAFASW